MGKLSLTGNSATRSRLAVVATGGAAGAFTDDFNRSDRTLNGDNGWTVSVPGGAVAIVSNQVQCSNNASGAWMTNTSGGVSSTNHYAEITIAAGLAGDIGGVLNRYTNDNNFYTGRCVRVGSDTYELYKRVSGTYTLLNSLVEVFPAEPFRIRLEVNGTGLIFSLWNGSSWVSKVTATDAALASGAPGWFGQKVGGTVTYDDYAHGNT